MGHLKSQNPTYIRVVDFEGLLPLFNRHVFLQSLGHTRGQMNTHLHTPAGIEMISLAPTNLADQFDALQDIVYWFACLYPWMGAKAP